MKTFDISITIALHNAITMDILSQYFVYIFLRTGILNHKIKSNQHQQDAKNEKLYIYFFFTVEQGIWTKWDWRKTQSTFNSIRKAMTFMNIFPIIMTIESIQISYGLEKEKWNDFECKRRLFRYEHEHKNCALNGYST